MPVSRRRPAPRPAALLLLAAGLMAGVPLSHPARAAGATYYVAPTGSDSNSGSAAAPFRQIRRGLGAAAPGDTVLVADGSYLGFDVRNRRATAAAPITVRATGTGAVVTTTTDRSDNRDTIFVTFSSYVVLDGLRAFNANRAAVRIDQSDHITVRNGVFGDNTTWGIFTDFSDDLTIENNECYGSRNEHGIYHSNSGDRPVLRGNRCHDNRGCGIHMNGDVSQTPGDGIISGALIENNVIYGNGAGGGSGINMDGVQDSTVRNNLVYGNLATGIGCYQIDGAAGPKGMRILHNTVDQASGARWALLIKSAAGTNVVRNNILYNRGTFRGGLQCGSYADVALLDSDYNIMDRVTPDDSTVFTLAQWKSQGYEGHSLSATPASLWTNPGVDYHLLPGGPAVDRGQTLAEVTVDIEGQARPGGPASDIGCDEIPAAPPASTTLTASPTSITTGGALSVSWTTPAGAAYWDWIGLFRVGDPNTAEVWYRYTSGATSGTFNLTGPSTPGQYEFRYFVNNGRSSVATSSAVTVNAPPATSYSLTPSATSVTAGSPLSISWTAPAGSSSWDWIGLFRAGDPNTGEVWYAYTGGATSGNRNLTAPVTPGDYEFRYLLNNGRTDVKRVAVTVTAPSASSYSLTPSATIAARGGALSISWTAPAGSASFDWIGLFPVGSPNTGELWWNYTWGAPSGTYNLTAPNVAGQYEFRYFPNNTRTPVKTSGPVTVN